MIAFFSEPLLSPYSRTWTPSKETLLNFKSFVIPNTWIFMIICFMKNHGIAQAYMVGLAPPITDRS